MKKNTIITLTFIFIVIFLSQEVSAIPAFARKYNFSCNVCHYTPPKLKAFGEDFAANGFQIPDKEPSRFYRKTGDDELLLMKEFPFAARVELYGQYENGRESNPDLRAPWIIKIMSGGNIAKDVSYYFYYFLSERGKMAGIEDAFIAFNDLIGEQDLDLIVGQFQVSDPLFKRELRLELEDYKIYTITPGKSKASLKYDRGIYFAYGLPTKTDLAFMIVNGNGIQTADVFDEDKYKNFMFRASQDLTDYLRIGGFGYYGQEQQTDYKNKLWMAGADLTFHQKFFELNAQYIYRSDDNPDLLPTKPTDEIKSSGGFIELLISPDFDKSKWTGALLYNIVDSDFSNLKYQSYTGMLSYSLRRNIRLTGEYTYIKDTKTSRFALGIWTAF